MTRPSPSTKPLALKLGVKPGTTFLVLNAPPETQELLAELPGGVTLATEPGASADCVLAFVANTQELATLASSALGASGNGSRGLCFAYPKISAKVETDITRDRGWEVLQDVAMVSGGLHLVRASVPPGRLARRRDRVPVRVLFPAARPFPLQASTCTLH